MLEGRRLAPLVELLEQSLHEREALLLFDNFEHVVEAAPLAAGTRRGHGTESGSDRLGPER